MILSVLALLTQNQKTQKTIYITNILFLKIFQSTILLLHFLFIFVNQIS
ncbi:hypothetical protein BGAFAR04_F0007 (plasmid) [Borreliella garinii Far04]|nr:hypothetical protein BGAFAR04_F0007 [Borreliella garinii Far04]